MTTTSALIGTAFLLIVAGAPVWAAGSEPGAPVLGPSAEADATTLHTGEWTKKAYKAAGTWTISEEDGVRTITLSKDFKTRNAPDLKLFLSPKPLDGLTGKNATDGAVRIAKLTSNEGAQTYEIPADVDLSAYETVIIHCERFSKLWSGAALEVDGE